MESTARLPETMRFEGNEGENFKRFLQNFEIYMVATGKDAKDARIKIAIFLNTIDPEGIEIYNYFKLTDAQQKEYKTIVQEFESYCTPRKNCTYERFVFNSRS